jgi:SAM-dependent methyltransferase
MAPDESAPGFKDHFSSRSAGYAVYRPTYPDALVDFLAAIAPGHALALDCACGTGQLSVPLARRFRRVIAVDASTGQISHAEAHDRIEYRVARAESSGVPDAMADLIAVAQAAHWLDLDRFYGEARRVARPGAALALITYGIGHVEGAPDAILLRFYYEVIGPYWPPERRLVETSYRTLAFPFREIDPPPLDIVASWRLADLLGYVRTWSAVKEAEQILGTAPMDALTRELGEVWGDPETRRTITWPLSVRAGRV